MRFKLLTVAGLLLTTLAAHAQEYRADTVIVPVGESSEIIFTIQDRSDLEILRNYDFQQLFDDIFDRLEDVDSVDTAGEPVVAEERLPEGVSSNEELSDKELQLHESPTHESDRERLRRSIGKTLHSYNIDIGTNNYLAGDQFPTGNEPYSVRPWGSWYVAINSVQRTRLGRNVFVEWGLGASWYNFKFQEDNILVVEDEQGVQFTPDDRGVDFIKSKLSATFVNASLIPVLDFGQHRRKPRVWSGDREGFRFGAGPYVGYRIASKTKLVYEENGKREKEKNREDFYLNNLRYGFRVQIGVRSTDLFINYDMNELFAEGKGPELNAISFGLTF